jgi:hypothetical protein
MLVMYFQKAQINQKSHVLASNQIPKIYDENKYIMRSFGWRTPKLLNGLKCDFELKIAEQQGIGAQSLARNILGVEGCARASGWD